MIGRIAAMAVFVFACVFSASCERESVREPSSTKAAIPVTPEPLTVKPQAAPTTRVRVTHSHGFGGCEGYLFIGPDDIRYEDSIQPVRGMSHGFICETKSLVNLVLIDNSTGRDPGRSAGYWINMSCPTLNPVSLAFAGGPAEAKQDFLRAKQARDGKVVAKEPTRPEISPQAKAENDRAKSVQAMFEIVSDPRYPGAEKFKSLLQPTAEFKNELLARKLVANLNRLYGWNLSEDGMWNVKQANNVMFEIVVKPGFQVDKALAAVAESRKP